LANCWTCSNCISKGFHSKLEELKKETVTKTNNNNNNNNNNSGNNSMNNTFNTNTDSNMSTRLNSEDEYNANDYTNEYGELDDDDDDDEGDDNNHSYDDINSISFGSLSNHEKRIILEEFCEIYDENNDQVDDKKYLNFNQKKKRADNNNKRKKIKNEPGEIELSDLFKHEENSFNDLQVVSNSQNTNESSLSGSQISEEPVTISQILQVM
jgi:hypothetical protein